MLVQIRQGSTTLKLSLVKAERAPEGMVKIPGGGLPVASSDVIPDYWMDKYEVTNKQFKQFLDAGGYRKPIYWKQPFIENGRTLSSDEAMSKFRDKTGRPGPSTWELGNYSEGQGDYPVTGVSWYEAAAYAEFAGKRLPTFFHWQRAIGTVLFGQWSRQRRISTESRRKPCRSSRTWARMARSACRGTCSPI